MTIKLHHRCTKEQNKRYSKVHSPIIGQSETCIIIRFIYDLELICNSFTKKYVLYLQHIFLQPGICLEFCPPETIGISELTRPLL